MGPANETFSVSLSANTFISFILYVAFFGGNTALSSSYSYGGIGCIIINLTTSEPGEHFYGANSGNSGIIVYKSSNNMEIYYRLNNSAVGHLFAMGIG